MSLLNQVTKVAPSLPSRVYLYAAEKFGKSSIGCYAPNPIFVMTEGETGLLSLIEAGRVPETSHFPEDAKSWPAFIDMIRAVLNDPHQHRTLVIDTANGAERLLQQHVCETEFAGQMSGREGYVSYGKGDLSAVPHWAGFLRLLDEIRVKRKMSILLLAHAKIKAVNNPEGSDYDQVRPEGIEKLWTLTHKWSDAIVCGTHEVFVKDDKVKDSKGRVLRTSGSVAVVAGNRYGLPEKIPCGTSAETAWNAFATALQKAKAAGKKTSAQQPPKDGGTPAPSDPPAATALAPSPAVQTAVQTPAPAPAPAAPPARDREPGEDDGQDESPTAEEPTATRWTLPGRIVESLLSTMHSAGLDWPTLRSMCPQILGRTMSASAHVSELGLGDAEILAQYCKGLKPARQAKAKVPA